MILKSFYRRQDNHSREGPNNGLKQVARTLMRTGFALWIKRAAFRGSRFDLPRSGNHRRIKNLNEAGGQLAAHESFHLNRMTLPRRGLFSFQNLLESR